MAKDKFIIHNSRKKIIKHIKERLNKNLMAAYGMVIDCDHMTHVEVAELKETLKKTSILASDNALGCSKKLLENKLKRCKLPTVRDSLMERHHCDSLRLYPMALKIQRKAGL